MDLSRLPDNFISKVKHSPTGCWEWVGGRTRGGYGTYKLPNYGGSWLAHRYAYEALIGPIPAGLQIDHLCCNKACVNPAHLEPVTGKENVRRGLLEPSPHHKFKTHCPRGHEYSVENTQIRRGRRHCSSCQRTRDKARGMAAVALLLVGLSCSGSQKPATSSRPFDGDSCVEAFGDPPENPGVVFVDLETGGICVEGRGDSVDFVIWVAELEAWANAVNKGCH